MEALSERTKVRVDGLQSEATEDGLRDHFCKYGEVVRALVERDEASGEPKGYGFVWFADEGCARAAVMDAEEQIILGTKVEVCETTPRERSPVRHGILGETSHRYANVQSGRNGYRNGKKIFVGGLPYGLTIEEFRGYFEEFGEITDAVIIVDPVTRKPRGFGFVTFNSEESARAVLQNTWHRIRDKDVEVKPAIPKEEATIAEQENSQDGYYEPAIIFYGTNLPRYGDIGHTYGNFNAFTPPWASPCGNGMSGYWNVPYMNNNLVTGFQGYNGLTARAQQTGIRIPRPGKLNVANDAYSSCADGETSSSVIGNGNREVSPSHLGSNNGHDRESTSTSGQPPRGS